MSSRSHGRIHSGRRCISAASLATLLAACAAAGPDYVPPAAPTGSHYSENDPGQTDAGSADAAQRLAAGSAPPDAWWTAFASPTLNAVVAQALAHSPTLQSARATLAQAQQVAAAAGADAYPQLTLRASAARGTQGAGDNAVVQNSASLGPALTYSVDAFGATARHVEQQQALVDAQAAQLAASQQALASGVVLQAIALASVLEQMQAVQTIVAVDQHDLELVRVSQEAGKTAGLDVLTAESHVASDRALLPPLLQQASVARHALAVLVGQSPADWSAPDFSFDTLALPQDLPLSLPSALLQRRPDIRAAEAQLRAANAAIGVASAHLYPSLTLSANWSAVSSGGGALFANPNSVWSLAAELLAPVFNGGALRAQREAATAAYAAQLGSYRQAVLQAFGQVADGMQALAHDAQLLDAQHKALDAARATQELTQQSFEAGQSNLLQVIDADRQYQQALLGYVRAKAQRYADTAQWFAAMGVAPAALQAGRP